MNNYPKTVGVLLSLSIIFSIAMFLSWDSPVRSQGVRIVPSPTPLSGEELFWSEALKTDTVKIFQLYLKEYPSGKFVEEAKKKIKEIGMRQEVTAWRNAQSINTLDSYHAYLDRYPFGAFINEAMTKVRTFQNKVEKSMWASVNAAKTKKGYRAYLGKYPYGEYAAVARLRLVAMGVTNIPETVWKNAMGMEFSLIPPGEFLMGSNDGGSDEKPIHRVLISKAFWMGRYEVTQGQWQSVMGNNPSNFSGCGPDCPVEQVSWNDAKEFISRLNAKNDGFVYSLPTEAEWEYAARAGTTTAFAFGDSLSSTQANFKGEYPYGNAPKGPYLGKTVKVGSYKPNAWGLYDMHGNVWEWVEDWYTDSYTGLPTDGSANLTMGKKEYRMLRGGSWNDIGDFLRSAIRVGVTPSGRIFISGFRVVARPR